MHWLTTGNQLINDLTARVARNCRISDARSWGYHSICGLLLRLRELYKWEHGLEPWDRPGTEEVMAWIGPIESLWEDLEKAELEELEIGGQRIDPFDAEAVNGHVVPLGCYYAAGHGMAMKPLFVLGELAGRREVDGSEVVTLGRELVRDLSPTPAMNRDGRIIARSEAMKWFLWVWLEEAGAKKDPNLAALALGREGVELAAVLADPAPHREYLENLAGRELEAVVHHELGEVGEERRLGGRWGDTFSRSCGTKGELLARGLKDVLADTIDGGRLDYLTGRKALVSVGLFAAFSDGLRKRLFPELGGLFGDLLEDGDWGAMEKGRKKAHRRMQKFVEPLLGLFEEEMPEEERTRKTDELEEKMMG